MIIWGVLEVPPFKETPIFIFIYTHISRYVPLPKKLLPIQQTDLSSSNLGKVDATFSALFIVEFGDQKIGGEMHINMASQPTPPNVPPPEIRRY